MQILLEHYEFISLKYPESQKQESTFLFSTDVHYVHAVAELHSTQGCVHG